MTKKNSHIGSTLESWLDEEGIRGEVTTVATRRVLAWQINEAMKTQGLTKSTMAEQMQTSRAQLDRLLDPDNDSVTLETLQRAAKVVGRKLILEFVWADQGAALKPNRTTIKAMRAAQRGEVTTVATVDDLFKKLKSDD